MQDHGIVYDHMRYHPTEENLRRLALSIQEAAVLERHDIRCPICNYLIIGVYGEKKGNISVKCRKCKYEGPLNLSYFRRQKLKSKLSFKPDRFGPAK